MITVIMPSYLGPYPGSRANPEAKFIRAVQSFLDQTLKESELIIIADGCKVTERLYSTHFIENSRIRFFMQPKGAGWPGELRQFGVDQAKWDIITYLDSDDMLLPERLAKLVQAMQRRQLLIDSLLIVPATAFTNFKFNKTSSFFYAGQEWNQYNKLYQCRITYQVCHRKNLLGVKWTSTESRVEDMEFIEALIEAHSKKLGFHTKVRDLFMVPVGDYLLCHNPYFGFDV